MGETSSSALNKLILNNFMVKNRPLARQGKDHTIKRLVRNAKKLREKKTENEKQKEKFHRKAERLLEEVMVLKNFHPDEVMKFALLNKKSYAVVGSNPKAKIEERALCRLTEHKGISAAIGKLREQHANWAEVVPVFIKGLGVRHRDKKLKKLERMGKLESFLEKEKQYLKLLQELTEIDIDPKLVKEAAGGTQKKEKKQTNSRSRKRKREMNLNEESLEVMKQRKRGPAKATGKGDGLKGKRMEGDERVTGGMREGSPASEEVSSESDEGSSVDGEDDGSDNEPIMGQELQNGRMQESGSSDEDDEASSDSDGESGSHPAEERRRMAEPMQSKAQQKPSRIAEERRRMAEPVQSKAQQKPSRIAEVKQLDLGGTDGTIQRGEGLAAAESEDEDFFSGRANSERAKRGKKRSDFFLGLGGGAGDSEGVSEGSEDGGSASEESDDDSGALDSGKYFKRNLYRSSEDANRGRGGQGRGRGGDRGQGRGRGRGRGGGERGQGRDRGRGQRWNRGIRVDRGSRPRGRGEGRRGEDKGDRGKLSGVNEDGDPGSQGDGGAPGRGGRGGRGGRARNRFGSDARSGDHRRGGRSWRGTASRFNKQSSWKSDAGNPNMIPLPDKKDLHVPAAKGDAPSGGHSLHPSWQAKLREKEKSASINQFKGKRMVFKEDT